MNLANEEKAVASGHRQWFRREHFPAGEVWLAALPGPCEAARRLRARQEPEPAWLACGSTSGAGTSSSSQWFIQFVVVPTPGTTAEFLQYLWLSSSDLHCMMLRSASLSRNVIKISRAHRDNGFSGYVLYVAGLSSLLSCAVLGLNCEKLNNLFRKLC